MAGGRATRGTNPGSRNGGAAGARTLSAVSIAALFGLIALILPACGDGTGTGSDGGGGFSIDGILSAAQDPEAAANAEMLRRIRESLPKMDESDVNEILPVIQEAASAEATNVRMASVGLAQQIATQFELMPAIELLVAAVGDADPAVRTAAITAIKAIAAREVVGIELATSALEGAVGDTVAGVQRAALDALAEIGPDAASAVNTVATAAENGASEILKVSAFEALGQIQEESARVYDVVRQGIVGGTAGVRAAAIAAFGMLLEVAEQANVAEMMDDLAPMREALVAQLLEVAHRVGSAVVEQATAAFHRAPALAGQMVRGISQSHPDNAIRALATRIANDVQAAGE